MKIDDALGSRGWRGASCQRKTSRGNDNPLSNFYDFLKTVTTELQPAAGTFRPNEASSPSDLVADLRRLRAQTGAPSLRELSRIAARRRTEPLPLSTTSEVLAGKRLPKLPRQEFLESYVGACLTKAGLTEENIVRETEYWRAAWQSLAEAKPTEVPLPALSPVRRKRRGWALVAAAFTAGAVMGSAGTRWYAITHPAEIPAAASEHNHNDACRTPGPAAAGHDVLAGTRPWWINNGHPSPATGDRTFAATVSPGTSRPGDLIIVKSDVPLVAGHHYTLTFTAQADRPARFRLRLQDTQPPLYAPSLERDLPVDTQPCHRRYEFTGGKTNSHSELTFQVGGQPDEFRLTVTAVTLIETG